MDKFKITNEGIEQAVDRVSAFLQGYKLEDREALRVRLALEEALLRYRDALGEDTVCTLKCIQRLGRIRVELAVEGRSLDPFASDDEEDFSQLLLSGLGLAPAWQYKGGQNVIVFSPKKKKPSQIVYILAAVALAVVTGFLSRLLPAGVQAVLVNDIFTPIADTFLGLLNAVAGLMIFLSVMWSVCSLGDVATFTSLGKKVIGRMLLMMTAITAVLALCMLPVFHFAAGASGGAVDLSGPFSMIIGIVPTNLVTPFSEGNFLQIMFLAAAAGAALLALGGKASLVVSFVEQANALVQLVLEAICSLISISIFITVYNMILTGSFSALAEVYKAPLLIVLGCVFSMAVYVVWICLKYKVSPAVFLRKAMPTFLIGLTTASSSAAMSGMMDACKKQYGIEDKFVNFAVPLGQILFALGSVVDFVVLSFCMAEVCQVAVTPVWLVTAIFTSLILTVAAPPIAGGGVALFTILFTQLGIPSEGLAIAVAIDVIADFLVTATNVFCRQSEIVLLAGKLNRLDSARLRQRGE